MPRIPLEMDSIISHDGNYTAKNIDLSKNTSIMSGSLTFEHLTDGTGTKVASSGGWWRYKTLIPIDETAKYRVTVEATMISGNGKFYCGVDTLNSDGNSIKTDDFGSYNYGVASGISLELNVKTKFSAIFSGYNPIDGGANTSFDPYGAYFSPMIITNYQGTGETVIHSLTVEKLEEAIDISKNTTGALSYTQKSDVDGIRVIQPKGAMWTCNEPTKTGYIKITLPVSWTNTMMSLDVDLYDYAGDIDGESFKMQLGGYNYSTSSAWANVFANVVGGRADRFFNVRFGHDGSRCAIYIGESNSVWSYPQISVSNFFGGYSGATTANWQDGWSIGITTTLGTITKTKALENVASYSLDSDKLDGIDSTGFVKTTLSNSNFNSSKQNGGVVADDTTENGIQYTTTDLLGQVDGALFTQAWGETYQHQIFGDYRTGRLASRGKNDGTWQPWKEILREGDTATNSVKLDGKTLNHLAFLENNKRHFMNAGTISYDALLNLSWDTRFISIANSESSTTTTGGYFEIEMPPVDTVITGLGGQGDVTVTADGIPVSAWRALWYIPPIGESYTSKPENFRIGYYSTMNGFEVPFDWILVAVGNGDGYDTVRTCDGRTTVRGTKSYADTGFIAPTFENGWVNYDTTTYGDTHYKRVGNVVHIRGLIKSGTIGSTSTAFTLPLGFRPPRRIILTNASNNSTGRLDITNDGKVIAYAGSNSWFSVSCSFAVA